MENMPDNPLVQLHHVNLEYMAAFKTVSTSPAHQMMWDDVAQCAAVVCLCISRASMDDYQWTQYVSQQLYYALPYVPLPPRYSMDRRHFLSILSDSAAVLSLDRQSAVYEAVCRVIIKLMT